jgi:hypothetical protein
MYKKQSNHGSLTRTIINAIMKKYPKDARRLIQLSKEKNLTSSDINSKLNLGLAIETSSMKKKRLICESRNSSKTQFSEKIKRYKARLSINEAKNNEKEKLGNIVHFTLKFPRLTHEEVDKYRLNKQIKRVNNKIILRKTYELRSRIHL